MGRYFDPLILARIKNLSLLARNVVEGLMAGLHRSALHGLSVEFAEHRPYAPGDELRRIDWKLYARQDRYYVKQFEAETNLRAYLFLDGSASMGYGGAGGMTKLAYGSFIAASLAYLMLLQRDAVGLITAGPSGNRVVAARSHPHHLRALIADLEQLAPAGGTDLLGSLTEVAGRLHRRGLFVLISDFLDERERLELVLKHLRHRRHDIMAFHLVDRDETDLPFSKVTLFRDLEGPLEVTTDPKEIRREYRRLVAAHLADVKALCHGCGADYELFGTEQPLDRALVRYLARRAAR